MKKTIVIIGCIIILLFVVIFIWPTKYRYTKATISNNTYPVRINRISGKSEYFDVSSGWIDPAISDWETLTTEQMFPELPPEDLDKITGEAKISYNYDQIVIDIYNGSNWEIRGMTFKIIKKDAKNEILWEREYREDANINPLTSGRVMIDVIDLENVVKWGWQIVSAVGSR